MAVAGKAVWLAALVRTVDEYSLVVEELPGLLQAAILLSLSYFPFQK